MGVVISGSNIIVDGQVAVAGTPTSPTHVVRKGDLAVFRAILRDVDLNGAAPLDAGAIPITFAKYLPVRVVFANPTANLALAEIRLFSAAGGAGTAITAATVLANLAAASKIQSVAIAALTDYLTGAFVYVRLLTAAGVAGTADVLIECVDLSDL